MLQLTGSNDKEANVKNAINEIRRVVKEQKPRLVALPECFNAPYGEEFFDHYAEYIPNGPTSTQLSSIAKELNIYLVGGSIIERDTEKHNVLYNTATVWSPEGKLIAKHRKVYELSITTKIRYCCSFFSFSSPHLPFVFYVRLLRKKKMCAFGFFVCFLKICIGFATRV